MDYLHGPMTSGLLKRQKMRHSEERGHVKTEQTGGTWPWLRKPATTEHWKREWTLPSSLRKDLAHLLSHCTCMPGVGLYIVLVSDSST